MKNCQKCGHQNPDEAVFCCICGEKLVRKERPRPQVAAKMLTDVEASATVTADNIELAEKQNPIESDVEKNKPTKSIQKKNERLKKLKIDVVRPHTYSLTFVPVPVMLFVMVAAWIAYTVTVNSLVIRYQIGDVAGEVIPVCTEFIVIPILYISILVSQQNERKRYFKAAGVNNAGQFRLLESLNDKMFPKRDKAMLYVPPGIESMAREPYSQFKEQLTSYLEKTQKLLESNSALLLQMDKEEVESSIKNHDNAVMFSMMNDSFIIQNQLQQLQDHMDRDHMEWQIREMERIAQENMAVVQQAMHESQNAMNFVTESSMNMTQNMTNDFAHQTMMQNEAMNNSFHDFGSGMGGCGGCGGMF